MNQLPILVSIQVAGTKKPVARFRTVARHPAIDIEQILTRIARDCHGDPSRIQSMLAEVKFPTNFAEQQKGSDVFTLQAPNAPYSDCKTIIAIVCDHGHARVRRGTPPNK